MAVLFQELVDITAEVAEIAPKPVSNIMEKLAGNI